MKASGAMIKPMDSESLLILTMPNSKVCGKMTNNTVKELRHGIMGALSILENFTKAKNKVKVDFSGMMVAITRVTLYMDSSKASENIILPIWTRFTRVNSEIVTWKEEELKYGMMEESMKVTSKMVRKTVKAHSIGLIPINTSAHGNRVNNMELVFG